MKKLIIILSISISASLIYSQNSDWQKYEANEMNPFGMVNPDAPAQLADFEPMIGTCDCKSLSRNPDGSWQDTVMMVWTFKYIMNGTAIQDFVWRENSYASSIRLFEPDSGVWVVSYHSVPGIPKSIPSWVGTKEGDKIVLDMPQVAGNGMEGVSRLTFSEISSKGFNWKGEWINEAAAVVYPFWQIWCKKRKI